MKNKDFPNKVILMFPLNSQEEKEDFLEMVKTYPHKIILPSFSREKS